MFILTDKRKLVGEEVKGVGVMKDEEIHLEEIQVSLTLGGYRTGLVPSLSKDVDSSAVPNVWSIVSR